MTTSDCILEVRNVSKLYARSHAAARQRLSSTLSSAFFGRAVVADSLIKNEIWAVKDVNISLKRGEALGIIGLNGSGKTTLLRMIAGQLLPDRGEIIVRGESASIIALTAGLQENLSGEHNIFIRSAMLGRSRKETEQYKEEIIEFSELGDAIRAPISTYSAGMKLRLAFAITIFTNPDLLIVDETLQVGDFLFRQKCQEKIHSLRDRTSFILVSHAMNDISRFCDRAIVLKEGAIHFHGDPAKAIEYYKNIKVSSQRKQSAKGAALEHVHLEEFMDYPEFEWRSADGNIQNSFYENEKIILRCRFCLKKEVRNFIIGVPVYAPDGKTVTAFSSDVHEDKFSPPTNKPVEMELTIPVPILNPGIYKAKVSMVDGLQFIFRDALPELEIKSTGRLTWGDVTVPHRWALREL